MVSVGTYTKILFGVAALVSLGSGSLPKPVKSKGTVLLFLSTDCPVAMQYTPRIVRLHEQYAKQGFTFKAVFPNALETKKGVTQYMQARGYTFDSTLDLGAERAKALGVTVVPAAVVLDSNGKVQYLGAIDDNKDVTKSRESWLANAVAAVEKGARPKVTKTEAFGCVVMPGKAAPSKGKVNYAEHIAPILNEHCVSCHRPGEVAPISLIGYENAKKWSPMINQVSTARKMPPWKAVHGFGDFQDENRLDETKIETLKRWEEAGSPPGDLKKAPKPPSFSGTWALGKPDMILSTAQPYKLGAEGSDEYRNFVFDPKNKETIWVTAMDVRPGNRKVVHHVIAFIDTSGQATRKAENTKDGQEGYITFGGPGFVPFGSLGGWAPGLIARKTADGTAYEVPPGAKIVMQVHYHRSGIEETDQTQLALYVSKQPPKQRVELAWLANPLFRIPAGADNHEVKLTYKVPADITIYGSMPHMHLLGKSMKAMIEYPDGSTRPLVFVDDWDFNWQMQYNLKEPYKVPKGSKILVQGFYDNSTKNPNNPSNPPRPVTWGEETTDEMFLLIVPFSVDGSTIQDKPISRFGG